MAQIKITDRLTKSEKLDLGIRGGSIFRVQYLYLVTGPILASPTVELYKLQSSCHPKQKGQKPPLAVFPSKTLKDHSVDGMLNTLNRICSVPFFNINPPGNGTFIRLDVECLKTGETFEQLSNEDGVSLLGEGH